MAEKSNHLTSEDSSGTEDVYANYDSDFNNPSKIKDNPKISEKKASKIPDNENDVSLKLNLNKISDLENDISKQENRNLTIDSPKDSELSNKTIDDNDESEKSSSDDLQSLEKNNHKSKNNKKQRKKMNQREKKQQKRHEKNIEMTNNKNDSKIEFENNNQSENNSSKEKDENEIKFKFYVYAPPEFDIDFEICSFAIIHNFGHWKAENLIKLNSRNFEGGYLVSGNHSFDKKNKWFEYKYCLVMENPHEQVEPFIEFYHGPHKNRTLNLKDFSTDTIHSIYDGIILPPDEGNQNIWKKITTIVFPKFIKRFFSNDMINIYIEDTLRAMLHEISTMKQDDERIRNYNCAKKYIISVVNSLNKSLKKINYEDLLKKFSKYFINVLDEHNKLTTCNSIALLEYITRSNVNLENQEIDKIHNVIMTSSFEDISQYKELDLIIFEKTILTDIRFVYLFEILVKIKSKSDSIDNSKYFDKDFSDIVIYIMNKFPNNNQLLYENLYEMLKIKSSKLIELVSLPFLILNMNNSISINQITETISIFEIIGNLCLFKRQINRAWQNSTAFYIYKSDSKNQFYFIKILQSSIEKFLDSSDINGLKSAENLRFISDACIFLYEGLKEFFYKENYSRFLILLTKLYVHNDICYIDKTDKDSINLFIKSKFESIDYLGYFLVLRSFPSESDLKKTLVNWSLLCEVVEISSQDTAKTIQELMNKFYDQSFKNTNFGKLVEICSLILKKEFPVHSNVERRIFNELMKQIDNMNQKEINDLTKLHNYDTILVQDLIREVINKKWPSSNDIFGIFNFLFNCNSFLRVFLYKNFIQNDNDLNLKVSQIISLLESTYRDLLNGNMEIYMLTLLINHRNTLIELYQIFSKKLSLNSEQNDYLASMDKLLEIRFEQIKILKNFLNLMNEFLKYLKFLHSKNIQIDFEKLEKKLIQFKSIEDRKLNFLSECHLDDSLLIKIEYKQQMINKIKNFDEIEKNKTENIRNFIEISRENIYFLFYIKETINEYKKPVCLEDFIKQIIDRTSAKYEILGQSLKNGNLELNNFKELAKIGYNLKFDTENDLYKTELKKVMNSVKMSEKDQEFRLKQLRLFLNLPKIREISELLLDIRKIENLINNFVPLEQILQSLNESQNQIRYLNDITNYSMKLFESLDKLSDVKFVKCLRKYTENFEFIIWLRSSTKDLNDLKLLCEFASQSQNEGALEVARVQSLLLVGTAFSPLIYEMDRNCSYEKMIGFIKQIFNNFLRNRELPEKIDAISKEKKWLKDIKDSMGNTEANSLKQVERINKHGIFDFGLKSSENIDDLTLEDIIKVIVPSNNDQPQKSYSFNQLRDLQNKIALVVGKDKKDQEIIEYFESFLESLINLGDILLSLLQNGNILFSKWNATIYNSDSDLHTMKINFGIQDYSQNIFAKRKYEKSTVTSIDKTFKFLEECSKEWLSHIQSMRDKFFNLNYFKTKQLVNLRVLMAKFISKQASQSEVRELLDLLIVVNPQVDTICIEAANQFAQKKINEEPLDANHSNNQNLDCDQKLLNELIIDFKFERYVILRAINELKTTDRDQIIDYCMQYETSKIEKSPNKLNHKVIKSQNLVSNILSNFEDPYNDEEYDDLQQKYDKIWEKFSEYLNLNFEDYVSLYHLGLALDHIKEQSPKLINREKPSFMEYNQPNLIVCPQDEIISRTLSIYSLSEDQPLPSNDEVLYCNSQTTSEEIELFWSRVLRKNQTDQKEQKIYALINVQDLMYDQAVKGQASFEKLMSNYDKMSEQKFLVCIICSIEREDKSIFVTAFNRFRKNVTLPRNINTDLNIYLRKQFKQKKEPFFPDKYGQELLNVQVITSDRTSVGKSLYIQRQIEYSKLKIDQHLKHHCVSIKKQSLPFESVFKILKDFDQENAKSNNSKIYHIDIAYEVWYEVDYFLFNLLCLGVIVNSNGKVFRRSPTDLFLVEIMSPKFKPKDLDDSNLKPLHSILSILPSLKCITPSTLLENMKNNVNQSQDVCPILFDEEILNSEFIQRPCQYLHALDNANNVDNLIYQATNNLNAQVCLELLLNHLESERASWSEVIHFANFLNTQLVDCERSVYCDPVLAGEDLPGFKTFVVKFMVQMSHDFALPSLEISDRSALQLADNNQAEFQLNQLKMRRKWENDPHPYLFFNPDGQTFTFFGFFINRATGEIIDHETKTSLFERRLVLSRNLIHGIYAQNKNILYENIAGMRKEDKIRKLLSVMGINSDNVIDPDPSYELTMDNLLKILAIYMRLRANIPVIIMGETGCGKTRLCRYMCDLFKYFYNNLENMYLVKVHGGTTADDIIRHVHQAENLARKNWALGSGVFTVLFFDEANSTEAIGTIKEIMCDSRVNGVPLDKTCGLKIIAACNPYKKHSKEIIRNFDKSGLGFYVDTNETQEKLGDLPMRHLVYRVQPLPASMLPLIWDFGQLSEQVESLYINQIVHKKLEQHFDEGEMNLIVKVLCASQKFMREQQNECSFVSLRDIQRVLKIIQWFMEKGDSIFRHLKSMSGRNTPSMLMAESLLTLNQIENVENDDEEDYFETRESNNNPERHKYILKSIILALNACYHVGLQDEDLRSQYRIKISECFADINIDEDFFLEEINNCYDAFLNEINLPDAIARNQALKENIFMILICIELKIPLFIIGKPGSSKSLAKTLISNKMQGSDRNSSALLRTFKEAHLITFQCSPMSTSEMILNTFRYCARYQFERRNDLNRYTSVIVLDEIGLAEASASMPLKTLHPLLEDGVHFEEKEEKELLRNIDNGNLYELNWNRIGFIGISNWVLDPAKMNRGIFVNRNSPSTTELKDTVIGICKNDEKVLDKLIKQNLIESMSSAYLNLCEKARNKIREFFGLRDFYALIKMIYWYAKENDSSEIDWPFLERAIKRNFGGLIDLDPVDTFIRQFQIDKINLKAFRNNLNAINLVKEALLKRTTEDENRYLLLLSQNDNALDLINNFVLNELDSESKNSKVKIIFGSSFPNDQKYSQICRKIHQIKLSMELGKTVILLNLENLYESLYDALNQFYYKFGDDSKFVDLGLGTARVKCLVHEDFRLIVVADKKSVYNPKKYPIPLINRLEKHLLSIESILNKKLKYIVRPIEEWVNNLTSISAKYAFEMKRLKKLKPSDIFIGFTDETIPSLVYKISKDEFESVLINEEEDDDWLQASEKVQHKVKIVLLQSSTSDGVIRLLSDKNSNNQNFDLDFAINNYYKLQAHENFNSFFEKYLQDPARTNFIQITTHSKLLSAESITIANAKFQLESLLSFDSQQQFVKVLKHFFSKNLETTDKLEKNSNVLIVQCDCGHIYSDLVNCARFTIIDEYSKYVSDLSRDQSVQIPTNFFVVFIIQVPKIAGGCFTGFQTSKWFCYHIDDLQNNVCVNNILDYENKSLSEIFAESLPEINQKSFKMLMNILESVIFNACSKVNENYLDKNSNDAKDKTNRAVQRIEKLLALFKVQKLGGKFFPILIKHFFRLQSERETELSTPEKSKSWMLDNVSKINNVIKYATLKNSCQNYMENRLAHLFAGIIALIDTNHNLDLLLCSDKEWISDFWLHFFDDSEILGLKYMNNFKANYKEKNEFICINSFNSQNDANLKLKLPFSWIIKDYLDKLIQLKIKELEILTNQDSTQTDQNENSSKHSKEQMQNAFEQSILKKKLDLFFDSLSNSDKMDFILSYVNDFILLSSTEPFINLNHFKLVKDRLINYNNSNYFRMQNNLNFLIGLHCSQEKLNLEIKLLSKFAKIDPNCIDILTKSENQDSNISFLAARILCNKFNNISNEMKMDQWSEWFEKVQKTLAIIEKMMDLNTDINYEKFPEFDSLWQQTTLLKLYIENICIKENDLYQRCFQFWKYFSPTNDKLVDFKKKETFQKFVRISEIIFNFGKQLMKKNYLTKCVGCDSNEQEDLFITADCPRCLACFDCIKKTELSKRCQICTKNQNFDDRINFQPVTSVNNEYKQKINSLKINFNTFYMDVVKNLCFNRYKEKLPDDEVIDLIVINLLPKVKSDTNNATLDFNHTPSIKSSLFQLLLNFNEDAMRKHLLEIFTKSENYLKKNYFEKDLTSLKLMYLNAIEDNFYSRSSYIKYEENFKHDIQLAVNIARDILDDRDDLEDEVSRLKFLAKIRFCFTTCSKLLANIDRSCENQMNLINLVKILVQKYKGWCRLFLVKSVFRINGRAETLRIANDDISGELIPNDLISEKNNRPKTYALFGKQYNEIKKLIENSLITENFEDISKSQITHRSFEHFFLSIFDLASSDNSFQNEKFKTMIDVVKNLFKKNKEQFDLFLNNAFPMANIQKQNFDINIQFLIMHVFASYLNNANKTIFKPFAYLINNPEKFSQRFLPSIPHDDDFEVYKALANNVQDRAAWYQCPNGHLYTIGNCTKPDFVGNCPTCKCKIGGMNHVLIEGNRQVQNITEKESRGYSLDLNDTIQSIRNMGQLNTVLIRLLLDCCMYLSAFKNPAQTKKVVHSPNIDVQNLQQFFLEQIGKDIRNLSQCLQHSPDESLLVFHIFVHKITTSSDPTDTFDSKLKNKEDRNKFEKIICDFIRDRVFENKSVDKLIEELNQIIKENATDSDKLLKVAFDDIELPDANGDFIYQKKFWAFRRQITLDLMKQNFSVLSPEERKNKFRLLSEFMEKIDTLKAIKYLPSLLKMLKTFHRIFNRQIDRQTSLKIKLRDILNDNPIFRMDPFLRSQIENSARDFLKVWKILNSDLISKFDRQKFEKFEQILKNKDEENFADIPFVFFLPASKNEGFVIYSVIFYLVNVHNEFIRFYIDNRKKNNANTATIGLENVTKNDLISFSPDKDILRLVYIHSNYSLEESRNINLEFNFDKIQSSIEAKIISDKPLIDSANIPLIEFSDNTRNDFKRFEKLEKRANQKELSFFVKEKINLSYNKPDQLNDIIRKLNIVIDFVISTGCLEDTKIMDYATDTLKMTNIDRSSINKQINELDVSYLKSLWNLLNLRRAILLSEHGQDPFDSLNDLYRDPIIANNNQEKKEDYEELVNMIMANRYQKPEKMLMFIEFMYKYIIYRLIPNSDNFEKSKNEETELLDGEMLIQDVFDELQNDPDFSTDKIDFKLLNLNNIRVKNVYYLWKISVYILTKQ